MAPAGGVLKQIQKTELSACGQAASFLQSDFWGAFKARFGWEALAFNLEWGSGLGGQGLGISSLLVLRRRLAAGFSIAYIPWGPELPELDLPPDSPAYDEFRASALKELALALKDLLPSDTAFIRFDPPWFIEGLGTAPPPKIPPPFVRAGADIQAPDTVLVNLSQPMDEILAQMKPKWRYNAKLAIKKGVALRRAGEDPKLRTEASQRADEITAFYGLLKETARRDGIAIHNIEYYRDIIESSSAGDSGVDTRLYLAEHEGDLLAGLVSLFRGNEAVYLYGASADKKRYLMAPYALQLKVMEDAQAAGCREYDLFGIPPNNDPAHPMAGLYRFKTGFGGKIIHRPGSWDFPCRPLVYRLFRFAEALRKKLRTMKKRSANQ